MQDRRKETGRLGEELALSYLFGQGYGLLARNYRCMLGEIDLIVSKGELIVFVEVRSLRSSRFGIPQESVRSAKQDRVRRVAQHYLKGQAQWDRPLRFDVVAIVIGSNDQVVTLNHIQAAF
jgi:putative endonuclease